MITLVLLRLQDFSFGPCVDTATVIVFPSTDDGIVVNHSLPLESGSLLPLSSPQPAVDNSFQPKHHGHMPGSISGPNRPRVQWRGLIVAFCSAKVAFSRVFAERKTTMEIRTMLKSTPLDAASVESRFENYRRHQHAEPMKRSGQTSAPSALCCSDLSSEEFSHGSQSAFARSQRSP